MASIYASGPLAPLTAGPGVTRPQKRQREDDQDNVGTPHPYLRTMEPPVAMQLPVPAQMFHHQQAPQAQYDHSGHPYTYYPPQHYYPSAYEAAPVQVQQYHAQAQVATEQLRDDFDYQTAIQAINADDFKAIVLQFVVDSGAELENLRMGLRTKYLDLVATEQKKVINFDQYSKSVWRELNVTHACESGSRQYESAGDAYHYAVDSINSIARKVKPHSPFKTKRSAIEKLRKIGKTICLTDDTLGHEVRKLFQYGDELKNAMQGIVDTLSEKERTEILEADDHDGKGNFESKLEELLNMSRGLYIFEDLRSVLHALQGATDTDPGETSSEDDQDE